VTDEEDDKNVIIMTNIPNLLQNIIFIYDNTQQEHQRYIPLLDLISKISNSNSGAADTFMELNVQTNILLSVSKAVFSFK
jgi:hypothetical protein